MAEDKNINFDREPDDNDDTKSGNDLSWRPERKGIGEKIRERNREKYETNGLTNLMSKLKLNELLGYAAAMMFFALSGMIFFRIYDTPGMSPEYRIVLSLVLFLYGVYRVVTTRGKASSTKRRQRIEEHRASMGSNRGEN
ncbi:MAG: hypothetical protein HGA87_02380 [Desulfobulbaceae bacterium]|nr:hypothetical protein [Desulfobulbaceae bacterium]